MNTPGNIRWWPSHLPFAIAVVLLAAVSMPLAQARGGFRLLEVRPIVQQGRFYSLRISGSYTAVTAGGAVTGSVPGNSIGITSTLSPNGWESRGSGPIRVTEVLPESLCSIETSAAPVVRVSPSPAKGVIALVLTVGGFEFPPPRVGVCKQAEVRWAPVASGDAITSATAGDPHLEFPLGGGALDVRGESFINGPGSYRLRFELIADRVLRDVGPSSVGPSSVGPSSLGPSGVDTAPITVISSANRGLAAPAAAGFHAIAPVRVLDTRDGVDRVGPHSRIAGGRSVDVEVATAATGVPADAIAVALNATVVDPAGAGFLTLFPSGSPRPTVSNLNFVAGQTVPNLVQVKTGAAGRIAVYDGSTEPTDVVLDIVGYYAPRGAMFLPSVPDRSFDVSIEGGQPVLSLMAPGNVGGRTVRAVARNVTIDRPSSAGWLQAFPSATPTLSSNINFTGAQTVANAVISGTSEDSLNGVDGQAVTYRLAPSVDRSRLVVDTLGRFVDDDRSGAGLFVPIEPCRALDTRPGPEHRGDVSGRVSGGSPVTVQLAGRCGLPDGAAIGSVALNVTAVDPSADGYVTLWTHGDALPITSTVNFRAGQTVPNHTIVYSSDAGAVSAAVSFGTTDLVIDVYGYYTA